MPDWIGEKIFKSFLVSKKMRSLDITCPVKVAEKSIVRVDIFLICPNWLFQVLRG